MHSCSDICQFLKLVLSVFIEMSGFQLQCYIWGSSFFLFNVMSGSQLLRLHISLLPCYTTCMHDPSALNTQQCESYNLTWPKTLATYCQCESYNLSWPKTLARYCHSCICELSKVSIIVTETFTSHSLPTFLKALILYSTVCLLIF